MIRLLCAPEVISILGSEYQRYPLLLLLCKDLRNPK